MRRRLQWRSVALAALLCWAGGACSEEEGTPTDTTVEDTEADSTEEDTGEPVDTVVDDTAVDTLTEDTVGEDTSVADTVGQDTTVEDTTVEDTVAQDTTVQDTTVQDTVVQDTVVQDTVVQDTAVVDTAGPEECDLAVNVAHVAALEAAQPVLEVHGKDIITRETTFASLGGDPETRCPVTLDFRDLDDDGALTPYEDWTLTPAERSGDLLGRMSDAQKVGLLGHPALLDTPTTLDPSPSAATLAHIAGHIRAGRAALPDDVNTTNRARWANAVQEAAEATPLGVPFLISMEPAHSEGNTRARVRAFSRWPHELGLGATTSANVGEYAQVVRQELRAEGVRLLLSVPADRVTEPRWFGGQFSLGEDATKVADLVEAYVLGLQGDTLGPTSVAAVVSHFPGAGAAKGGFDGRLEKGKLLSYPGGQLDQHLAPFARALDAGAGAVMPAYGVPESGSWTALGGLLQGATIEQVGAPYNSALLTTALRGHYGFDGPVIAPEGVLDDAGGDAMGAPWGVESLTRSQRTAKAIGAGVDQFLGLGDLSPIADALATGALTDAQLDAAAGRVLVLMFRLGLFDNPYVDPSQAPALVNTDASERAGLRAMNASMILILNKTKPTGFLNGTGDGTQTEDKGNAGNGTLKVLPAPPGEPYEAAGCAYYIAGGFDLDYVRSVSDGYGAMTNDMDEIYGVPVATEAERMARSDYVFIRIAAPHTDDPDSGPLGHATASLEYAGADNADVLTPLAEARAAIDATVGSRTQIIVGVDGGRPSVVSEILAYDPSGLYVSWSVTDKVFLDVAFGIVNGSGRLPVGLPLSDAAATAQLPDVAGDGQHPTFVAGYGVSTTAF